MIHPWRLLLDAVRLPRVIDDYSCGRPSVLFQFHEPGRHRVITSKRFIQAAITGDDCLNEADHGAVFATIDEKSLSRPLTS